MTRPRRHAGDTKAEVAILDAAERLLPVMPFHDLTTEAILREAGVSRGTFYFYFGSKVDVLTALMWRIYDELFAVMDPWLQDSDEPPEELLRRSMSLGVTAWEKYGSVAGAMLENVGASTELAELWDGLVERAVDAIAAKIDAERERGVAPPGPDSRVVAAVLTRGIQNIMYAGRLGLHEALPTGQATLGPSADLWCGVVYGHRASSSR